MRFSVSILHFAFIGTPSSVAKPRVLNDSLNDCQTPRCPSPQARPSSPTVCTSLQSSLNFAFCILHWRFAPRPLRFMPQFHHILILHSTYVYPCVHTCRSRFYPKGTSSDLLDFIRRRRISLQGTALPARFSLPFNNINAKQKTLVRDKGFYVM